MQQGLSLIEERSGALGRFLRSYAQLARLPKPNPKMVKVPELVSRIAELEKRLPVSVHQSPELQLVADSDQLEQLLINIVRNAVDASLETGGGVAIGWKKTGNWFEMNIDDEGKGLPDTSNLFVPFFTTKPNGSGHRPGAQPADRRGPRRHHLARESRACRLPRDAQAAARQLTLARGRRTTRTRGIEDTRTRGSSSSPRLRVSSFLLLVSSSPRFLVSCDRALQ